jgi:hypothetical protein
MITEEITKPLESVPMILREIFRTSRLTDFCEMLLTSTAITVETRPVSIAKYFIELCKLLSHVLLIAKNLSEVALALNIEVLFRGIERSGSMKVMITPVCYCRIY